MSNKNRREASLGFRKNSFKLPAAILGLSLAAACVGGGLAINAGLEKNNPVKGVRTETPLSLATRIALSSSLDLSIDEMLWDRQINKAPVILPLQAVLPNRLTRICVDLTNSYLECVINGMSDTDIFVNWTPFGVMASTISQIPNPKLQAVTFNVVDGWSPNSERNKFGIDDFKLYGLSNQVTTESAIDYDIYHKSVFSLAYKNWQKDPALGQYPENFVLSLNDAYTQAFVEGYLDAVIRYSGRSFSEDEIAKMINSTFDQYQRLSDVSTRLGLIDRTWALSARIRLSQSAGQNYGDYVRSTVMKLASKRP